MDFFAFGSLCRFSPRFVVARSILVRLAIFIMGKWKENDAIDNGMNNGEKKKTFSLATIDADYLYHSWP